MEPGDGGVDAGRDTGVDSGLDAGPVEDLGTCAQDSACTCTPAVTAVGLSVVAHGAQLSVTGACLTGVTTVRVGGVTQGFVVNDDGRLTIASVADTTPVGLSQPLVAMSPQGSSTARNVTVAHLVVNEVDTATDMGGMQRSQFVEIDTGLAASVNLAEYMVVFFTGADDGVYDTTRGAPLGTTAASGLYLLAGSSVSGAQATLPNSTLASTTDAHAVVLYQGTVLPPSTETLAGLTLPMIDALVYSRIATTSDAGLLDVCYPRRPGPCAAGRRLERRQPADPEHPPLQQQAPRGHLVWRGRADPGCGKRVSVGGQPARVDRPWLP